MRGSLDHRLAGRKRRAQGLVKGIIGFRGFPTIDISRERSSLPQRKPRGVDFPAATNRVSRPGKKSPLALREQAGMGIARGAQKRDHAAF